MPIQTRICRWQEPSGVWFWREPKSPSKAKTSQCSLLQLPLCVDVKAMFECPHCQSEYRSLQAHYAKKVDCACYAYAVNNNLQQDVSSPLVTRSGPLTNAELLLGIDICVPVKTQPLG